MRTDIGALTYGRATARFALRAHCGRDARAPSSHCRLPIADCRLRTRRTGDFGLRISECGFIRGAVTTCADGSAVAVVIVAVGLCPERSACLSTSRLREAA